MGLAGVLLGLALLVWLAFRGWTVLLLAPAAALLAASFAGEPLLAHWTQTFMGSAAQFLAQFFPLFLMGALFGKLMEDSGSVSAIARWMTERLGTGRAILAVVLAGALVTYGGVSLFVAFFVLAPMAEALFHCRYPAPLDAGGDRARHLDLHHVSAARDARDPERDPDAVLRHDAFRRAGAGRDRFGHHAGLRTVVAGRAAAAAQRRGEGFGDAAPVPVDAAADDPLVRERTTTAHAFDPAEIHHSQQSETLPPIVLAALPLVVVVAVNLLMSFVVLPRIDTAFLAEPRWGATSLSAVGGVWSVAVALTAAIVALLLVTGRRLPSIRQSMDAGANAAVLPAFSVASLVGFGAVVAALPAFALVRGWVLGIDGGPLVSLAVATNVLSALTGSASGGLTIALDALGPTYMQLAAQHGIEPALLHRVAVIGAGTLDSLPHNGAVVTLLAVCGSTLCQELLRHRYGGNCRRASGARRRDCARQPAGLVLVCHIADDRAGHAMPPPRPRLGRPVRAHPFGVQVATIAGCLKAEAKARSSIVFAASQAAALLYSAVVMATDPPESTISVKMKVMWTSPGT